MGYYKITEYLLLFFRDSFVSDQHKQSMYRIPFVFGIISIFLIENKHELLRLTHKEAVFRIAIPHFTITFTSNSKKLWNLYSWQFQFSITNSRIISYFWTEMQWRWRNVSYLCSDCSLCIACYLHLFDLERCWIGSGGYPKVDTFKFFPKCVPFCCYQWHP